MRISSKEVRALFYSYIAPKIKKTKKVLVNVSYTKALDTYKMGSNKVFDAFLEYCGVSDGLTPEFVDRFRYNWKALWNEIGIDNYKGYGDAYLQKVVNNDIFTEVDICILVWVLSKSYSDIDKTLLAYGIQANSLDELALLLQLEYDTRTGGLKKC